MSGGRIGRRLTLSGDVKAEWHPDAVLLWRDGSLPATTMSLTLPVPGFVTLSGLSLSVSAKTLGSDQEWRSLAGPHRSFACPKAAAPPLTIRFPRPGDRFQPLGAGGSQKLQDFFVNRKVPRAVRPYVPLVLSRRANCLGSRAQDRGPVQGPNGCMRVAGIVVFRGNVLGGIGLHDATGRRLSGKEPVCYDARIVKR